MKHYFKWSAHIIIGLIVVTIVLLLWKSEERLPEDLHIVPPLATSSETANMELMRSESALSITTEAVAYIPQRTGFYAHPETPGNYPGIVMIHEWWGLNDVMRDAARELASQGYHVLAVDLFGTVATTQDEARKQTGEYNQEQGKGNLRAATTFLHEKGALKVASLGWCFGGGQSLQLALSGEQLAATVIYYGNVTTDIEKLRAIRWPVLGIFAGEDRGIPPSTVNEFRDMLNELGIKNSITIYPGVSHAFANPSGQSYAPEETKDAWQKTLAFLAENIK